jgi:signal transduction histidine kinase
VHDTRAMRAVALITAGLAIVAICAGVTIVVIAHGRGHDLGGGSAIDLPFLIAAVATPACVGAFVAQRRPGNRVAWILLVGALGVGVVMCASALELLLLSEDRTSLAGRWAGVLAQEWPVLFLWPLALAFRFPDGELPGPRWRIPWRITLVAAAGVVGLLPFARHLPDPFSDVRSPMPVSFEGSVGLTVFWVCWAGLLGGLFAGAAAVWWRVRRSTGVQRLQVLWLAYAAFLVPLWLSSGFVMSAVGVEGDDVGFAWLLLLHVWLAVAVAVAVTRHGLYGIDRLVNRTLVYGALTLALAAAWGAVALGAGVLVGRGSALAASVATLAAALAFRPLRGRIQAAVDWRFARSRYEGVRRVRAFLDEVRDGRTDPEDVGAQLAAALRDPTAEVLFLLPASGTYADRTGRALDAPPDDGRARTPIGRDDREVGLLLHDPALLAHPELLRSVADAAAMAVEIARLRVEVRLQLAEVDASRARIVHAGMEERRRLERDLHDGAQQRLVTLGIVLRRVQRSLPAEARSVGPSLDAAVDEVVAAITDLRTIAAGLRPPRLEGGLGAALAELAGAAAVPVSVAAGDGRAPPEVEAAAYYVACEALTNAVKHASASAVRMQADRVNGTLRLLVEDDGVGGAALGRGTGLAGLADRVAAHGGRLDIHSPPGAGTRIAAEFPCGS